jgi:uncharacterized protein
MTITMHDKHLKDEWVRLVESMSEDNKAIRSAYSKAIAALHNLTLLISDSDMSATLKQQMLTLIEEVIE